jgi:hypothetical protein
VLSSSELVRQLAESRAELASGEAIDAADDREALLAAVRRREAS